MTHTLRISLCLLGLVIAGCVSVDIAAPPVASLPGGAADPILIQGRRLYLGKCTRCHSPEPIKKYPWAQWQAGILPDMVEETGLSEGDAAAVAAYVKAVWGA